MPFDSGVSIEQMLDNALKEKIDVLFVTNHDTLNGYNEILDYQQNHRKYYNIKIYPAEEITIDNRGHVLAYAVLPPGDRAERARACCSQAPTRQ